MKLFFLFCFLLSYTYTVCLIGFIYVCIYMVVPLPFSLQLEGHKVCLVKGTIFISMPCINRKKSNNFETKMSSRGVEKLQRITELTWLPLFADELLFKLIADCDTTVLTKY